MKMLNEIEYRSKGGMLIKTECNCRVYDDTDSNSVLYIWDGNVPSAYRVASRVECIGAPRDYVTYTLSGLAFKGWTITIYDSVE